MSRNAKTSFFLVRHASHAEFGRRFVGRMGGVVLDAAGREQSRLLADRLSAANLNRVQSSPCARARQTAEPIAARTQLPLEIVNALDEIDAGDWSGRTFEELQADQCWLRWNSQRAAAGIPGGECIGEVRARIVDHLERMRREEPGGCVVMVSHAEVIRSAVLHYLALPLDAFGTIDIEPASVTTLLLGDRGAKVVAINELISGDPPVAGSVGQRVPLPEAI